MSEARDEILGRLRRRTGRKVAAEQRLPPAWQTRRAFPSLVDRFTEALTAAKGEVVRAADLPEALEQVGRVLQELNAKQVVVNGAPAPLDQIAWSERFPACHWHVVGQSNGDLRAFCASADVGISGAEVALAETGTVTVHSGPRRSRLATLLPPVHLVLLPTERLTSDLFTWVEEPFQLPANLVLISGPSKTADIEQTLAIGVHGPKRLLVVVYGPAR